MRTRRLAGFAGAAVCLLHPAVLPAHTEDAPPSHRLKHLSLEELMNVEVTSVSRRQEPLHDAAAAIAVVTGEDIKRAGAATLPEALRLIPGIYVARRNANSWAISARGFSSVSSEKLLVLTDTRSIYTPLYSGVFWDAQDYFLNDIERIEVIRGPGGALWGSNAVNGVINVTTKPARDTQGLYVDAGAGSEEKTIANARYGGAVGDSLFYRLFVKHADRDSTFNPDATRSDDWRASRFGFRIDWEASAVDSVTISNALYRGDIGLLAPSVAISGRPEPQGVLRTRISGGNLVGRWRRALEDNSELQVRLYYDRTHRDDPSFLDNLDTVDLDVQHGFPAGERHAVLWGFNYRYTDNENVGRGVFALAPTVSEDHVLSAFVQDQIALGDVRVTLGTKFEHNDFSGFEIQPSVRAAWTITPEHTLWAAVSRATRSPTRIERDIAIDVTDPAGDPVTRLIGNEDFESEVLLAYEVGLRFRPLADLSLDLAAFHNRYRRLTSLETAAPFIDPADGRTVFPIISRNLTDGVAQGVEALATYAPLPIWRLTASYAFLDLKLDPSGDDLSRSERVERATPRHQFGLRAALDLPGDVTLDAQWRRLGEVQRTSTAQPGESIPAYAELDARIAWRVLRPLELALVGQNLLHDHHVEFGAARSRGAIERGFYAKFTWEFQ